MAATTSDEVRAVVHVAGPVEQEFDESPRGYVWVQRCLRCDDLVGIWRTDKPPRRAFRLGRLIAADPYQGIAGGRQPVDVVADYDAPCAPTPVSWL